MNTRPDERLTRMLHDRVDGQSPSPIPLLTVTRRAQGIRRRRRTATTVAVAAVVAAIAVPSALVFGGEPDAAPRPSHHGTPTPGPSPSGENGKAGALAELPAGPRVGVYTLGHRVVVAGGGGTLPSLYDRYALSVAYHGGWLAFSEALGRLVQTDAQGRSVANHETSESPFAVSQDGTEVAWFWFDGSNHTGHITLGIPSGMSDSEQRQATPAGVHVQLLAMDQGRVYYQLEGKRGTWVTDFVHPPQRVPGLGSVSGYDPVHQVALSSDGNAPSVYDVAGHRTLQTLPIDFVPIDFSPDGKLVLGEFDNGGPGPVDVALMSVATGRLVTRFDLAERGIVASQRPVWQSNDSFLIDASDLKQEAILRLSSAGSLQRVTPLVKATPAGYGVVLP